MPTQVQNNIVLPPIQKFIPQPEKPAEDVAPRRGEQFGEALKTARKKSAETDKPEQPKEKDKDSKTEAKKKSDEKETRKASSKQSQKASQTAKSAKNTKSKSAEQASPEETGQTEQDSDADPAIANQAVQTAATDETEAASDAQKTKAAADAKDDADHPEQGEQNEAASDAAAAQLVQAVDRAKDQNPHRKNPDEEASEGDQEEGVSAVSTVTPKSSTEQTSGAAAKDSSNTGEAVDAALSQKTDATRGAHAQTVAPINLGGDAELAQSAASAESKKVPATDASAPVDPAAQLPHSPAPADPQPADSKDVKLSLDLDPIARAVLESQGGTSHQAGGTTLTKATDAPPPPPEVQFAQSNHDKIVTGVQSQLLPHGGSMEIRLDPPELGALKVMVEMRDGVMSATFQTSSEEATQLLSHSLNQLKHVLETQGVSVERLQVQQAPKGDPSAGKGDSQQRQQQGTADDHAARQEQQRKEMMRRMWRRVSGAGDPIDYLA
jgi:flagellar hook-length control protein FliK